MPRFNPSPDDPEFYRAIPKGYLFTGGGRYRVESLLGAGTFGSVYQCESLSPRVEHPMFAEPVELPPVVAIKVFHTDIPADAQALVRRELAALLSVNSPQAVRVLDWSVDSAPNFLVMPFYKKGSIDKLLTSRISPAMGMGLMRDVLVALIHAHRASVLHLDIKPSNVLMNDDGRYILADFGISHGIRAAWKMVGMSLGMLSYQAPEQDRMKEGDVGIRTDIFGLGARVWAMLTGMNLSQSPWKSGAYPKRDAVTALPDVCEFVPECPEDFADLLMQMVKISPDHRPGSAAETLCRLQVAATPAEARTLTILADNLPPDQWNSDAPAVVHQLLNPFWRTLLRRREYQRLVRHLPAGTVLAQEGATDPVACVLLQGRVEVQRAGHQAAEGPLPAPFAGIRGEHGPPRGLRRIRGAAGGSQALHEIHQSKAGNHAATNHESRQHDAAAGLAKFLAVVGVGPLVAGHVALGGG